MTAQRPNPTLRSLRLREMLRSLRQEQGKRIEDVAGATGLSTSALSRMETGERKILPRTVRLLAQEYSLTASQRDDLVALAKEAEQHGWWSAYGEAVPEWFESYVGLEAAAESIRVYENELVHGLFQTPEYARELFAVAQPDLSDEERERRVELRIDRQHALQGENAPDVWAILNEAVIHRKVGGSEAMQRQMEHLLEVAELPNVKLQVLPFSLGAHAAMDGRFTLLTLPQRQAPDLAYIEYIFGSLYLDKKVDIKRYSWVFDQLRADALAPRESSALIDRARKELR
jgi:transcriptional regulator with XRE-family HTH domain